MDKKLRVFKLRNVSDEDLAKGLTTCKDELSKLRIAKVAGGTAAKLGKIRVKIKFFKNFTILHFYLKKILTQNFQFRIYFSK